MLYTLKGMKRSAKGPQTREQGQIPGIVYGAAGGAESVALEYGDFVKLYRQAGESTLIDMLIDGVAAGKVIIQEVQHDPVKDHIIHVDLRRIDMNKTMTAPVELRFVGEAPVVKEQGGTLVTTIHTVTVECLPKDLVSHIDIDLSILKTYDDIIKIKNLAVPAGITIVNPHTDDLIVKATRALTEDEIKALEEAAKAPVDLSAIEAAGKKKEEEGEETAEGAPAEVKAEEKKAEKKEEKK